MTGSVMTTFWPLKRKEADSSTTHELLGRRIILAVAAGPKYNNRGRSAVHPRRYGNEGF
jgi:hypothetical protein